MRTLIAALLCFLAAEATAQEVVRRANRSSKESASARKLEAISTTIKGVCVDGKTGKPLAGCVIHLHAWGRNTKDLPTELLRPANVITGADGKFEVRVLAQVGVQVGFDASRSGCWPRTGRWRHLLPSEVEDLGKVPMHPGVHAVGKIVDENGTPMKGVTIGISKMDLFLGSENGVKAPQFGRARDGGGIPRAMHSAANNVRWSTSGDDGTFTSKVALPAGTHPLRLNRNQLSLVEPRHITVPETGPMEPITVVVREQPFVAGKVVDEQGQPVAGVTLHAEFQRVGAGRLASGRSKKDGTFKIYRVDDAPDKVGLSVMNPGPCERKQLTEKYTWGQSDIVITLQRALSIDVVVVDSATGKPIEDFAVRAYPIGRGMNSQDHETRLSGNHKEGKLSIDRIPRGKARIVVIPKDPKLQIASVDIVAAKGLAPTRIEVTRMVAMIVQVLDAEGAPAKKATVLVIEPGNQPDVGFGIRDPRGGSFGPWSSDPTARFDTQLFRTTTDEGGQCIVYGIAGRKDLVIGVRIGDAPMHRDNDIAFGKDGNGHTVQLKKE